MSRWVAWGSLAPALSFGNSRDALRENDGLTRLRAEILIMRMHCGDTLQHAAPGTPGLAGGREDLQAPPVAIDRFDFTPAELLTCCPEPQPASSPEPEPGNPTGRAP